MASGYGGKQLGRKRFGGFSKRGQIKKRGQSWVYVKILMKCTLLVPKVVFLKSTGCRGYVWDGGLFNILREDKVWK